MFLTDKLLHTDILSLSLIALTPQLPFYMVSLFELINFKGTTAFIDKILNAIIGNLVNIETDHYCYDK